MGLINTTLANGMLKGAIGSSKVSGMPATLYIGCCATLPTMTSGVITVTNECTGGGYARVAVSNVDAQWTIASRVATNVNTVQFATATSNWTNTPTYLVLFDASSGGNALGWATNSSSVAITTGTALVFAAGAITITLT